MPMISVETPAEPLDETDARHDGFDSDGEGRDE